MNLAKRLILIATIGSLSVLTFGILMGNLEEVSAAPPVPSTMDTRVVNSASEPVPVAPQGTVDVSGTVGLSSSANTVKLDSNTVKLDPAGNTVKLDSAGSMTVSGSVGLSSDANTVKLDPSNNTVKIDPTGSTIPVSGTVGLDPTANTVKLDSNTVKLDPNGNTVKLDSTGMTVSGTVGLSSDANTVKFDAAANTVGLSGSANVVKLDPSNNTVKIDATSSIPLSGTVGFSSSANTVKIDHAYSNSNPVKVWGLVSLDSTSNNKVQVTNPITPGTNETVPLLVQVAGGVGGAAEQPVQFKQVHDGTGFTGTYAVPTGKILKIEHVSVFAKVQADYPQANVETTMGGVTMQHVLPRLELEEQSGPFWTEDTYRVSAPVTFYADGGTTVRSLVRGARGGGIGTGFVELMFSGYLTDK